jgi:glycosyltransferase involved in cell wall biosynthesis
VFVGDGPLRKSLAEACPEAYFAGVQKGEELAAYYASADLFLFPSMTETYGNVVPEAMASGLAVVSYDCAAALELIEDGVNGMLVPTADDVAFVNASVQLASDSARIASFRAAAVKAVEDRSWDAVADTFLQTLRSVLERHGRPFASPAAPKSTDSGLPAKERLAHSHARPQA